MKNVKADGKGYTFADRVRTFVKRCKHRFERRKAKLDPECQETYGKYRGWLS